MSQAVNDARVDDLVDGDHRSVLEIVDAVNQAEAHFEQQTQRGAQLLPALRVRALGLVAGDDGGGGRQRRPPPAHVHAPRGLVNVQSDGSLQKNTRL